MPDHWYSKVEADTKLTQGDLIVNCPLVGWRDEPTHLNGAAETEVLRQATDAFLADTVVMTQACDLEHEKVSNVVVCPHYSLTVYKQNWDAEMDAKGQNPTVKAWQSHCKDIRDGLVWNLSILNSLSDGQVTTDHRVVDFHDVYTVPRVFLETLLAGRKQPRLRLLPPYREHLSQAFARFFMRVGLPVPVTTAW
jgi:hypothetical protein